MEGLGYYGMIVFQVLVLKLWGLGFVDLRTSAQQML